MNIDSIRNAFLILILIMCAIVFGVLILPKMLSPSTLPMPEMRSYILGHAYDFLIVHHFLRTQMRWFRGLGEVFTIWIIHKRVVVTANPVDVVAVLRNPEIFARPPAQVALFNELQADSFQTMDRQIHHAQRQRMRDGLSSKTIHAFSEIVSSASADLVAEIRRMALNDPAQCVDITPLLADATFRILLSAVLGSEVGERDRKEFAQESRHFLNELFTEITTYPIRRVFRFLGVRRNLWKKHRAVQDFAGKLVDERASETEKERSNRPLDMMDIILEIDPNDRDRQISNATMFAIAGFESSSEALAWALYEITGRPEVSRNIQSEVARVLGNKSCVSYEDVQKLTYLKCVWNETLRLHPAAGFLLRVATKDTILPGSRVTIPEGLQVGALISGAQRNAKIFESPDEFLPERWYHKNGTPQNAFLPFSCGPERCPGRPLADYEGVVILAHIFRAFNVTLGCEREEVVGISDWTERAKWKVPDDVTTADQQWSLPIIFEARNSYEST